VRAAWKGVHVGLVGVDRVQFAGRIEGAALVGGVLQRLPQRARLVGKGSGGPVRKVTVQRRDGAFGPRVLPGLPFLPRLLVAGPLLRLRGQPEFLQADQRLGLVPATRKTLQVALDGGLAALGPGLAPGFMIQAFQMNKRLLGMDRFGEILHEQPVTIRGIGFQRGQPARGFFRRCRGIPNGRLRW
jgi:hypothetical protein